MHSVQYAADGHRFSALLFPGSVLYFAILALLGGEVATVNTARATTHKLVFLGGEVVNNDDSQITINSRRKVLLFRLLQTA